MDSLINNKNFRENLLRLYLGKHESRFYQEQPEIGLRLTTKSRPKLAITLISTNLQSWIVLCEHIEVEQDDAFHDYYSYYSREIIRIPAEDPDGIKKIENAVTKTLIAGS